MAKTTKTTNNYQGSNKFEANAKRKLNKHCKSNPNDSVAAAALKNGITWRRKTPKSSMWSPSLIAMAKIFKEAGAPADHKSLVLHITHSRSAQANQLDKYGPFLKGTSPAKTARRYKDTTFSLKERMKLVVR